MKFETLKIVHKAMHMRRRERVTTDIDLMRAEGAEVVPAVRVGLELEESFVVWVWVRVVRRGHRRVLA